MIGYPLFHCNNEAIKNKFFETEEPIMKNLIKKMIAAVTAVCVLCVIHITSYADTVPGIAIPDNQIERTYRESRDLLYEMRENKIHITIEQRGAFVENKSILYGRRALSADWDGNFVLGPWEEIFYDHDIGFGDDGDRVISGDYVCFAYSVDIGWGTDWPFSRIFWNNMYTPVHEINICVTGFPRAVVVLIDVDGLRVVNDWDCDAHSEWKP